MQKEQLVQTKRTDTSQTEDLISLSRKRSSVVDLGRLINKYNPNTKFATFTSDDIPVVHIPKKETIKLLHKKLTSDEYEILKQLLDEVYPPESDIIETKNTDKLQAAYKKINQQKKQLDAYRSTVSKMEHVIADLTMQLY